MASPKYFKLHIRGNHANVIEDNRGQKVESLCEQYHSYPKVVSVPDFKEWTGLKGYTDEVFCGHCRSALN